MAWGVMQSDAPEAGAPEALVNLHEASTKVSTRSGTPEVTSSGVTPSAPVLGDHAQGFGRLRPNFAVLRKRKGSPSCSGDAFRPLKQTKYIAIDE